MNYYRYLAWKFLKEEIWEAAMLCTQMSMTFADDFEMMLAEGLMERINMTCDSQIEWPEDEEEKMKVWKSLMNKYNIPQFKADAEVLNLAMFHWQESELDGDYEKAKYYKEIYKDLEKMDNEG